MLRIVLSGVLAAAIIYIGMGIKKHYLTRAKLIGDIVEFITKLQQEVSFLKPPIAKVIDDFCGGRKHAEIVKLLRHITLDMTKLEQIIPKSLPCLYLHEREKEMLLTLLINATKLDSKSVVSSLEGHKQLFSSISLEAKDKSNKLGQLSFKLAVMLAVLAMIIVA